MLPQQFRSETNAVARMAGTAKASLVLLAMRREVALDLLKGMAPEEVRAIVGAAEQLRSIDAVTLAAVVAEFEDEFNAGVRFTGSAAEIRDLVEEAVGAERVAAAMEAASEVAVIFEPPWAAIEGLPDDVIRSYVLALQPQAAAFFLSKIGATRTVTLLQPVAIEVRNDLLSRLISVREPALHVLRAFEEGVRDDLLASSTENGDMAHRFVAGVLNQLDQTQAVEALGHIARQLPEDARLIRKLLFRFEDVGRLPPAALGILVERLPLERLVVALKDAPSELILTILSAMAPRARRMAESELNGGAPVTAKSVTDARRLIADAVLKLAAAGAIDIGSRAEGDSRE